MDTAKLFRNGQSQAVRLPKQYAFPGIEVYVKKVAGVVMLMPKDGDPWEPFTRSLDLFTDDFLATRPEQGAPEKRSRMK
jgi:antitoxin VapB